jgi:methyl-CpG-binding domain protein 4
MGRRVRVHRDTGRFPPLSPENLIQEAVRGDPWRILLVCVLLNRTHGREARPALWRILDRWPTAEALSRADPADLAAVIARLGFQNRRAATLIALSTAIAESGIPASVEDLPGVGRYAADSYDIFVRGRFEREPEDKELRRYVRWLRSGRAYHDVVYACPRADSDG